MVRDCEFINDSQQRCPLLASVRRYPPGRAEPLDVCARHAAVLDSQAPHQSTLPPAENKFHVGNGENGKHYWITPPDLYRELDAQFSFDFDPCPYPLPEGFDGLTCEWGQSNYVNPPFGSIIHQGRKKGPTAWVRKALAEQAKGKRVVLVYPLDKWILMLLAAGAKVSNLGDVRWLATEDGSQGKGTGRHIACFVLGPTPSEPPLTSTACRASDGIHGPFCICGGRSVAPLQPSDPAGHISPTDPRLDPRQP